MGFLGFFSRRFSLDVISVSASIGVLLRGCRMMLKFKVLSSSWSAPRLLMVV